MPRKNVIFSDHSLNTRFFIILGILLFLIVFFFISASSLICTATTFLRRNFNKICVDDKSFVSSQEQAQPYMQACNFVGKLFKVLQIHNLTNSSSNLLSLISVNYIIHFKVMIRRTEWLMLVACMQPCPVEALWRWSGIFSTSSGSFLNQDLNTPTR